MLSYIELTLFSLFCLNSFISFHGIGFSGTRSNYGSVFYEYMQGYSSFIYNKRDSDEVIPYLKLSGLPISFF